MQEVNTIYELEPVFDNPKYRGFAFLDDALLGHLKAVLSPEQLDFYMRIWRDEDIPLDRYFRTNGFSNEPVWDQLHLKPAWKPLPVIMGHKKALKNDYPCINLMIPAVSPRAVEAIEDILKTNGELLPLADAGKGFFAYNVLTVSMDAIDKEQTLFKYITDRNGANTNTFSVLRYHFNHKAIQGLHIFRLPEVFSGDYFVTNLFKEAAEDAGLRGFVFNKLWPFSPEEANDPDNKYSDSSICNFFDLMTTAENDDEDDDDWIEDPSLYSSAIHDLCQRYSKDWFEGK